MSIKKEDYLVEYGIPHVTREQVHKFHTVEESKNFEKFMYGQTVLLRSDGTYGIYSWDYERWINSNMPTEQGLNWD